VRQVIRGERHDVFRTRRVLSISTCHGLTINGQPAVETALNFGAAYGRAVSKAPFVLSANGRLVEGRAEKTDVETLHRIPSARTIARLMTVGRDTLSKAETVTVAALEAGVPSLVEAREIIAEFHLMIRAEPPPSWHPESSALVPVLLHRSLAA
jgi:hypothetical protein